MFTAPRRSAALLALIPLVVAGFVAKAGSAGAQPASSPVVLPDYQISLFASGTSAYTHPDSVVADGSRVYIGYQNSTPKDGSSNATSTVVQYDLTGAVVATYNVVGHVDGLRVDPTTHLVWATSNEDANPLLVTIDPTSSKITPYTFPPTPHGGGYDDMAFANGSAYIAASNPTLNAAGVNPNPAVDRVTLNADGTVSLTPILAGNASATDVTTKQTVTLNEIDPDSMTLDPSGNVVLDNQGGAELVTIHNPGAPTQSVSRLPLGTQVDDTEWVRNSTDRLLIVDSPKSTIWSLQGNFTVGAMFTEAPSDSGVASFVGTIDPATGTITPIAVGFGSPTGLTFVPASTGTTSVSTVAPGATASPTTPVLAASYVRVHRAHTWTTITWYSSGQVRSYNVFDGQIRINRHPVTSTGSVYRFRTHHQFHHLRLVAVR